MRKIFILFAVFFVLNLTAKQLSEKIEKYSGKNANDLKSLLNTQSGDTLSALQFLLENCSSTDLAVLTSDFLMENIRLAEKTKQFKYTNYPQNIYQHFVLPYRVSQEPLENWRREFYPELKELVKDEENIEAAAILVNLWVLEQMTYKPTHGRDQAPLTTIKRGFGRCEEMMIIYIAAARSVGIPARPASVPYWNFTDSNHAWVEVWTPAGWKYLGEPENTLNKAWFTKTTKRATLITTEAFGNYDSKNTIKQLENVTYISSIEYYTEAENCQIEVLDQKNTPVPSAKVTLYAASFGGLFPMIDLQTDENGICKIPLGKGTIWLTAAKGKLFGHSVFPIMEKQKISITLQENKILAENFNFLFPLVEEKNSDQEYQDVLSGDFDLMRENKNLKRDDRLHRQRKSNQFVKYFDLAYPDKKRDDVFFRERETFLQKCDEMGGNTQNFLHVLRKINDHDQHKILINIIEEWDVKELCEIPDSTAIENVVKILQLGKKRFEKFVPDSLFQKNVVGFTWKSATLPQNGWQKDFYEKIKILADDDLIQTVENVKKWVQDQTVIDDDFVWTYFSNTLNPLQIINMKYIPEFYQQKLLNCTLKLLGVPVRWKGRLEYFAGKKFLAVNKIEQEDEQDKLTELEIALFIDGKQRKAEPFENFLLAKLDDNNRITYSYFDGENDSLSFSAEYRRKPDDNIYLEAFTRNANGDANISVLSVAEDQKKIKIYLKTPNEYLDLSEKWNATTLQNVKKICENYPEKNKLLFIRAEISSEPQISMLKSLTENSEKFEKNNTRLILYSENRSNDDAKAPAFIKLSGEKLITEKIDSMDYPVIFLLSENNKLVFSSKGFNLGIANLLMQKAKRLNQK